MEILEGKKLFLEPEDYDRLEKIPMTRIRTNDKEYLGRFDEELGRFFMYDEEGNMLTEVLLTDSKQMEIDIAAYEEAHREKEPKKNRIKEWVAPLLDRIRQNREKAEQPKEAAPRDDRKKRTIFLAIAIPLLILMLLGSFFTLNEKLHLLEQHPEKVPSQAVESQNQEKPAEETPAAEDTIEVLQVQRDMVPGDRIEREDLQIAAVSAEFYNQSTLNRETQFYQGLRADDLVGKYITDYVQKGQYLSFGKVDNAYICPVNPWMEDGESVYLTAALPDIGKNLETVTFGSLVHLHVTKTTLQETPIQQEETDEVAGITHQGSIQQSVVLDQYQMDNVVVSDLLDKTGSSVWYFYASWMKIPSGEQTGYVKNWVATHPEQRSSLTPAFIRLRFTKEQADVLEDLKDPKVSVEFEFTGEADIDTEKKAETLPGILVLKDLIEETIKLEETKNEGT